MPEEPRDIIWRDIDQSGVELEMRVTALMAKRGWIVKHHPYYLDYDEGKGRELDLLGEFGNAFEANNYQVYFELSLLVECKKIPGNAWTFFAQLRESHGGARRPLRREGSFLVIHSLKAEKRTLGIDDPLSRVISAKKEVDLDAELYRETVVNQKKSNKRIDNVFEASMVLMKAREYYRREELEERDRAWNEYVGDLLVERSEKNVEDMESYLGSKKVFDGYRAIQPVVVFEGDLFVASLQPRSLVPANLVRLWLEYSSAHYKVPTMSVDVCAASYFPNYLQTHEDSIKRTKEEATAVKPAPSIVLSDYEHDKPWMENVHLDVVEGLAGAVDDIPRPPVF